MDPAAFRSLPHAKGSFATKRVNPGLLAYDPQGRTQACISLMLHSGAKLLDVRTVPVAERTGFVNDLVSAGCETHLNFSPVVVCEGFETPYCSRNSTNS